MMAEGARRNEKSGTKEIYRLVIVLIIRTTSKADRID
jgi:hypothetical protein